MMNLIAELTNPACGYNELNSNIVLPRSTTMSCVRAALTLDSRCLICTFGPFCSSLLRILVAFSSTTPGYIAAHFHVVVILILCLNSVPHTISIPVPFSVLCPMLILVAFAAPNK